ncbi:MAG: S8 family serine peptidase, partial [Bdellovibrionota bacterium]
EGMISVGSIDTFDLGFSLFSNYSSRLVELSAPGAFTSQGRLLGLLSSIPKDSYGYLAGTSMASPIVSGAAALVVTWLKAYDYSVSPSRIEMIMKNGARPSGRLNGAVQNGRTLDLEVLAQYLEANYPPK